MKNRAFERGVRIAGLFKKLTKTIRLSNDACLNWVHKKGLPEILGRLPVPIAMFCLLITALLCGLLIGSIIVIAAMFIYMLCNLAIDKSPDEQSIFAKSESYGGSEYRNGASGYGYYSESRDGSSTGYKVDIEDDD